MFKAVHGHLYERLHLQNRNPPTVKMLVTEYLTALKKFGGNRQKMMARFFRVIVGRWQEFSEGDWQIFIQFGVSHNDRRRQTDCKSLLTVGVWIAGPTSREAIAKDRLINLVIDTRLSSTFTAVSQIWPTALFYVTFLYDMTTRPHDCIISRLQRQLFCLENNHGAIIHTPSRSYIYCLVRRHAKLIILMMSSHGASFNSHDYSIVRNTAFRLRILFKIINVSKCIKLEIYRHCNVFLRVPALIFSARAWPTGITA